jgi:predicted phosphate transport protein (TIGR00153 family)
MPSLACFLNQNITECDIINNQPDKLQQKGRKMLFGFKRRKPFQGSQSRFFEILSRQASKTLEGLEALWNFVENESKENANLVRSIEREADELRRILVEELDQTFVTPLDREDIYALSRAIDDVVDYANTTVDEMEIYEVRGDEHIREMVNILRKVARELNDAVNILKDYPKISLEHAVKAKSYENQMEKAYHLALAHLFKGTDTVYMLKMREIYRHLSNAADRGDEAADIISSIVMKHT